MRGLRGDESSEIGHVVKPVENLRWRDRKLNCDDVKKTTAKVKNDRKMFKSGQMFDFGIQKYRLIASCYLHCSRCCKRRPATGAEIDQLYVHLFVLIIWPFFVLNGPVGKR